MGTGRETGQAPSLSLMLCPSPQLSRFVLQGVAQVQRILSEVQWGGGKLSPEGAKGTQPRAQTRSRRHGASLEPGWAPPGIGLWHSGGLSTHAQGQGSWWPGWVGVLLAAQAWVGAKAGGALSRFPYVPTPGVCLPTPAFLKCRLHRRNSSSSQSVHISFSGWVTLRPCEEQREKLCSGASGAPSP